MNPEDIEKAIHDGIARALQEQLAPAVSAAVTISVNGKIDGLRRDVKPLLEAYATYTGSRRLIFWIGGAVIGIGSFMVALQQIYQITSAHLR
jgi:beta-lactamase regulating signal transducer with metallopeptidase domain